MNPVPTSPFANDITTAPSGPVSCGVLWCHVVLDSPEGVKNSMLECCFHSPFLYMSVCLSVSIFISICLTICFSISLSLYVYLFICLSISLECPGSYKMLTHIHCFKYFDIHFNIELYNISSF